MATVLRDFTYFDRSFAKGDELDDTDPAVTLMPHMFEQKTAKPAQPKSPKKEKP